MNTLTLIKNQIEKQHVCMMHKLLTLHIVVLSMSAIKLVRKYMVLSVIAVAPTPSDRYGSTSSSNIRFYF